MNALLAAVAAMLLASPGVAQNPAPGEEPPEADEGGSRITKHYTDYIVQTDGNYEYTITVGTFLATQRSVSALGQASIPFKDDTAKVEVLEAYTLKRDGTKVPVPADRIITNSQPVAPGAPVFSARKRRTIIFSDVEVGDSTFYMARVTVSQPDFPGVFSAGSVLSRAIPSEDVRVSLSMPATMVLEVDARGLQEQPLEKAGDRIIRRWTYANKQPVATPKNAIDPWNRDPRLVFSTFADWAALARGYDATSAPAEAITPEITALAQQITAGVDDPTQKARLLHAWVSKNIRYVAITLGNGGFVPHSAASVLANRYGDCKDHAALFGALLKAKGIESSPVLVHTGSRFDVPQVATPALFNHVITWIPSLALYADSTSRTLPFGYIDDSSIGKPILKTRGTGKIETLAQGRQTASSVASDLAIKVAEDGGIGGRVTVVARGAVASSFRRQMAALKAKETRERFMAAGLTRFGLVGTASLELGDVDSLDEEYRYAVTFKATSWLNKSQATEQVAIPSGWFAVLRLENFLRLLNEPPASVDQMCPRQTTRETTRVELPASMHPTSHATDASFANRMASFTSTYKIEGNTVVAERKVDWHGDAAVCHPEDMRLLTEMAGAIRKDFAANHQIEYRTH